MNERYKELVAHMLLQTYREAIYGVGRESIGEFIVSDWCEMLCEYVRIDYVSYRDKVLTALRDNKRQVAVLHGRA